MQTITDLFDESLGGQRNGGRAPETGSGESGAYNPDASMRVTSDRQAIIDEAFRSARTG